MKNLTTILFLLIGLISYAQDHAPNHLMIQSISKIEKVSAEIRSNPLFQNVTSIKPLFKKKNIYLLTLSDSQILESTMESLLSDPNIMYVSKDYYVESRATPNDEFFSLQDGIDIINAPAFWEKSTGGTNVQGDDIVVAIIDDGYDALHEDLIPNLWNNPREIDGDNIDNDNNGYVDDVVGVNVSAETDDHIKLSHGTSVAGIIGAKGDNGKGISGINWNVKLMLISTGGLVSDIVTAYGYAEQQRSLYNDTDGAEGAFVVASNSSFGIDDVQAADFPIWCGMFDSMGEVGIVSAVSTSNSSKNIDITGDMPSTCTSPYIIAVTSTDAADVIQGAFGPTHIDIAAPGDEMYSCKLNNEYSSFGGTSAAAPMAAGAVALLHSLNLDLFADNDDPAQKALRLRNAIVNSSRSVSSLGGSISSGGVLDLERACNEISEGATPVNILSFGTIAPNPVSNELNLDFTVPLNAKYEIFIHNALGQLFYISEKINDGISEKELILDIENWSAGYYAITIQTSEEKVGMDFIKI